MRGRGRGGWVGCEGGREGGRQREECVCVCVCACVCVSVRECA